MNINEFPQQVNQVISIAETILQDQILGIYLYGSATMNGLRPDSDIDIECYRNDNLFYPRGCFCSKRKNFKWSRIAILNDF